MESRESQRDKRIQGVLNGTKAGGGNSPSASVMRAREELQGIDAERAQNLEQQKAFMNGRRQQMATMRQAAMIGASGLVGGAGAGVALGQQVSAMNPQTQAILSKYGVNPGKKSQSNTSTKTNTQQAQAGPNNIRTVTTNTTNNNTRNEIRIVQPQIPMRQQTIPMRQGGDAGGLGKFKAWLDGAFAKQDNQYEIQQKEFRKREWSLARSSSKLYQKLTESTTSLGEKMDPKNMGSTFGGQIKTLLFLFMTTVIAKWWKPLMKRVANFEAGFRQVFGLPMNTDLEKSSGSGVSFVDKLKKFIGIDVKTEKGKNTSLIEGISNVFKDGIDRLIDTLKLFVEDRRIALQKINLPEFNTPKVDGSSLGGIISGAFGSVMKGVLAPATEYLGNILSAMVGGSAGLVSHSASNVKSEAQEIFKKEYGGQYFTSNSTDWMGNLKGDSTYGVSRLLQQNLNDKSNTLHTGGIMTGLNMLEGTAKREGSAVISPQLLQQLGFGADTVINLVKSGKASYVPMKIVQVPKSSAENEEFTGGSVGDYVMDGLISSATFGMMGGKLGQKGIEKAGMWAAGKGAEKIFDAAASTSKYLGKAGWIGAGIGAGMSVGKGIYDYTQANAGNSGFVTKAVPLSDSRPGTPVQLLSLTKEGFDELKRAAKVDSFDVGDASFQRWVEDRERQRKAMLGVKGKLRYQNPNMQALNEAQVMSGNYDAKMKEIWNDPNKYGYGSTGNFVSTRNNSATAIANGLSWAANGLNDLNFKFTGTINAAHIPAGESRNNAIRGINYLMTKYGLSKEAAAGIAGVIQEESRWNPAAQNLQEKAKGLPFGRGLCQWSNDWGTKDFPDWYQKNFGQRKYPDEVPLEHQLDYLMSGEHGKVRHNEFLKIIHKPGVTVEEATKAMYLGYENGGPQLTSFSHLASHVKAYGGESGVAKAFAKRSSSALGFFNLSGGDMTSSGNTGFQTNSDGSFRMDEDAVEGQQGWSNATWTLDNESGNLSFGNLKLADIQDIQNTLKGQKVDDSLMLGDWFVGRSINYLITNSKGSKSTGYCARHVRMALEAGSINTKGHPAAASDYIQYLPTRGFARIAGGNLQPGDIAILPAGGSHRYGHICMFTGQQWISDFIQKQANVYGGGWPVIYFRYTGKGGSGNGSLIDTAANMAAGALDAAGNVMSATANAMGAASDAIRPTNPEQVLKFDTSGLSSSQLATYKWMKANGAQEDSSGLFLIDKKLGVKANLDLNSGISATGNITKANIASVFHIDKDGRITSIENDQMASDVYKGKLIGDSLAIKVQQGQTAGSVVVDLRLGRYTDFDGLFEERAVKYYERNGGISYVIHEVNGDTADMVSLLTGKVPLLDSRGRPASAPVESDRYSMYDIDEKSIQKHKDYGAGSVWTYLMKKGGFRYKKLGRNVTSDFHPYLHGALKITLTREAQRIADIFLDYLRGELENEEDLNLLKSKTVGLNGSGLEELRKKVLDRGTDSIKTSLGISKESIEKSIDDYKSGKNKDNYSIWKDDDGKYHVLDKTLGLDIGSVLDKKGTGFSGNVVDQILKTNKIDIQRNLRLADLASGHLDVNADLEYERFNSLYGHSLSDPGVYKEFLKTLNGKGNKVITDERGFKWVGKIGPDGKMVYSSLSDPESLKAEMSDENFFRKNESYAQRLREFGVNGLFNANGELDKQKYIDYITDGVSAKILNEVFGGDAIDLSEETLKSGNEFDIAQALLKSAGISVDQANSLFGESKRLHGYKEEFLKENSQSRALADALVDQYNENGQKDTDTLFNSNGRLMYKDDFGRIHGVGIVGKDGAKAFSNDEKGAEEYGYINNLLHKLNKTTIADRAQREAVFVARFGAVRLGNGMMRIDHGDESAVFSVDSFETVPNDIDFILKHDKTRFFRKSGDESDIDGKYSAGVEAMGEGGWKEIENNDSTSNFAGIHRFISEVSNEWKKNKTPEKDQKTAYRETFLKSFEEIQNSRLKAIEEGNDMDKANAYLGNLSDLNAEQRDYLKLIAEHFVGEQKLKTVTDKGNHVDSIAQQQSSALAQAEVNKQQVDALTAKDPRLFREALAQRLKDRIAQYKGKPLSSKELEGIFYGERDFLANSLGISTDKNVRWGYANLTGNKGANGNYWKGLMTAGQNAPVNKKAAEQDRKAREQNVKNIEDTKNNTKNQAVVISSQAKVTKQEETNMINMSRILHGAKDFFEEFSKKYLGDGINIPYKQGDNQGGTVNNYNTGGNTTYNITTKEVKKYSTNSSNGKVDKNNEPRQ